jgi:asparagine synthase (glutamine-hydrolysing)
MARAIAHRGPDAEGFLERTRISLASRRLSILDLEGGDQPIFNEDRTVAVVLNGEIYNSPSLRAELEEAGHRFTTRTDTEVLVHLYERDGLGFAGVLRGMFAFALWDETRGRLAVGRDPLGIKPLFYCEEGGRLSFASEVKGLLAQGDLSRRVDRQGLHDLLNLRYVPGPLTLFEGVRKLPPGSLLVWEGSAPRLVSYHRFEGAIDRGLTLERAAAEVRALLLRAVDDHLLSDVEVGLYLSGGLDSGGILALLSSMGRADRPAFTLGFRHPLDENEEAAGLAARFGARHRSAYVEARPLDLLEEVTWFVEEPRVNSLQGYLLAGHAAREVKVVLGGLGGDELFGGYELNDFILRLGGRGPPRRMGRLARALNGGLLGAERLLGRLEWEEGRRGLQLFLSRRDRARFYLILRNSWDLDRSHFDRIYAPRYRRDGVRTTEELFAPHFEREDLSFLEAALLAELKTKLVDEYLATEDRVSMARSLEVRVPFLDQSLVEYALSIPGELKVPRAGEKKLVYRRALAGLLPREVLSRPKAGFSFDPVAQFQRDLRERARRELTRERLGELSYFEPRFIERILGSRPHPRLRWHYFYLWTVLAFSVWHRLFIEEGTDTTRFHHPGGAEDREAALAGGWAEEPR